MQTKKYSFLTKENSEKNVRVYFKVKNKLGMCECWREIKPKVG